MGRSKDEKRGIVVLFGPDEHAAVVAERERSGVATAELLRRLFKAHIEKEGRRKPRRTAAAS